MKFFVIDYVFKQITRSIPFSQIKELISYKDIECNDTYHVDIKLDNETIKTTLADDEGGFWNFIDNNEGYYILICMDK